MLPRPRLSTDRAPSPTDRRRQVRLVRRLPADAARSRGRAAGDRRASRHRGVRRGDLAPLVRPVRHPLRRRLGQHARAGRRDRPPASGDDDAGDDRGVRDGRRHPGAAQLGRSRSGPIAGLPRPGVRRVARDSRRPSPTTSPSTPSCGAARSRPISCANSSRRSWSDAARASPTRPSAPNASGAASSASPWPTARPVSDRSPGPAVERCVPAFGRGCYGCFGPRESANGPGLARWLESRHARTATIARAFALFNAWAPPFRRVIDEAGGPPGPIDRVSEPEAVDA